VRARTRAWVPVWWQLLRFRTGRERATPALASAPPRGSPGCARRTRRSRRDGPSSLSPLTSPTGRAPSVPPRPRSSVLLRASLSCEGALSSSSVPMPAPGWGSRPTSPVGCASPGLPFPLLSRPRLGGSRLEVTPLLSSHPTRPALLISISTMRHSTTSRGRRLEACVRCGLTVLPMRTRIRKPPPPPRCATAPSPTPLCSPTHTTASSLSSAPPPTRWAWSPSAGPPRLPLPWTGSGSAAPPLPSSPAGPSELVPTSPGSVDAWPRPAPHP